MTALVNLVDECFLEKDLKKLIPTFLSILTEV